MRAMAWPILRASPQSNMRRARQSNSLCTVSSPAHMTDIRAALQRTLGDAFTLEHELTGGGMSTVFVANDNTLNRKVVVKVLPSALATTVSTDRFNREILMSAALQHPHIVPVLSAGEVDGLPYFMMPFIDGESLRTRLTRGPLSVSEAVGVMRDVARALTYAHGRDVVHRDIKPDNILLTGGAAVVTDFGVAKALTASRPAQRRAPVTPGGSPAAITLQGIAIGTPAYMAPEQAAGDPNTDHRADLYALGVVAWEMLAGAAPFQGASPQQVMAAQLVNRPPSLVTRRYNVPRALVTIIEQLLEKEPALRPRTAADLARALNNPDIISGAFGSVPGGAWRQQRMRVAAVAFFLALAGFLFWWIRGRK
ncbi:MAG: protein kinase [Gemmatimonadetes bacterium]|nr:protein kinase [Gemmatimonadota bacterium]